MAVRRKPKMFPDAVKDMARAKQVPDTPQTRSPAYRLAFADPEFLTREELRPVRVQLELLKPELTLIEHGIESTIVLFGERFWRQIIDWEALATSGTINPADLEIFRFVETADEAFNAIREWEAPAFT